MNSYIDFVHSKQAQREDKDNIFCTGISDTEFVKFAIKYLLGDGWYVVDPLGHSQITQLALEDILFKYSKQFKKEYKKYIKKQRRIAMKLKGIELEGTYKIIYYDTSFVVFDEKGNEIYFETNSGYWSKSEYDRKGNRIYFEDSDGFWEKREYNEQGKVIYYENSYGYWSKSEYNEKDNEIYFENSEGEIIDKRVKDGERVKELTIEQIEKLLGYKIKIKGGRK